MQNYGRVELEVGQVSSGDIYEMVSTMDFRPKWALQKVQHPPDSRVSALGTHPRSKIMGISESQ